MYSDRKFEFQSNEINKNKLTTGLGSCNESVAVTDERQIN